MISYHLFPLLSYSKNVWYPIILFYETTPESPRFRIKHRFKPHNLTAFSRFLAYDSPIHLGRKELASFSKWRNWDSEMLSDSPRCLQVISERAGTYRKLSWHQSSHSVHFLFMRQGYLWRCLRKSQGEEWWSGSRERLLLWVKKFTFISIPRWQIILSLFLI